MLKKFINYKCKKKNEYNKNYTYKIKLQIDLNFKKSTPMFTNW